MKKPITCSVCNGNNLRIYFVPPGEGGRSQVTCDNCGTRGPSMVSEALAIKEWNGLHTKTDDSPSGTMSLIQLMDNLARVDENHSELWPIFAVIDGQEGKWDITNVDVNAESDHFVIVLDNMEAKKHI